MKGLLIIGAGGHGRVVADTAWESGLWDNIAFLDDNICGDILIWPVLGRVDQAQLFLNDYGSLAVAIGDNRKRVEMLYYFAKIGFALPPVIHPRAYVSSQAVIGLGTVVFAGSVINAGAVVGAGCIVNTGATVDHDCVLEEGVHLSPGVNLAGEVKVGRCSWVGIGSSVIQQVSIGKNVMIGAGAAVIEDVEDGATVVGVPGRVIKNNA